MSWILLFLGIFFNAFANILMKYSAQRITTTEKGWGGVFEHFINPFFVWGILCFGLALGAYSISLKKFELSVAYPLMTCLGLIIVSGFSFFFLKENFSIFKLIGMGLILLGVILVART